MPPVPDNCPWTLSASRSLASVDLYAVEIPWHLDFCVWLVSLSTTCPVLLCVLSGGKDLNGQQYSIVYATFFVSGHFGHFHILATVNSTAINIGVNKSLSHANFISF